MSDQRASVRMEWIALAFVAAYPVWSVLVVWAVVVHGHVTGVEGT